MSDLDLYKEAILEEAAHPANLGKLANFDRTYRYGNASCGDMFTVYVKLDEPQLTVKKIGWDGAGCAISTAAMSLISQELVGKTIVEIEGLDHLDAGRLLGLEIISPGRIACVAAGLKAVQKAVAAGTKEHS
ncbi:iron-sulfur cluster assembly scaffold protein [Candidatus Woesebacteria bacterium]|nr:iron-sulfur cluster assembly scaffold protein [Candidatus Woesebacteria bacterium]